MENDFQAVNARKTIRKNGRKPGTMRKAIERKDGGGGGSRRPPPPLGTPPSYSRHLSNTQRSVAGQRRGYRGIETKTGYAQIFREEMHLRTEKKTPERNGGGKQSSPSDRKRSGYAATLRKRTGYRKKNATSFKSRTSTFSDPKNSIDLEKKTRTTTVSKRTIRGSRSVKSNKDRRGDPSKNLNREAFVYEKKTRKPRVSRSRKSSPRNIITRDDVDPFSTPTMPFGGDASFVGSRASATFFRVRELDDDEDGAAILGPAVLKKEEDDIRHDQGTQRRVSEDTRVSMSRSNFTIERARLRTIISKLRSENDDLAEKLAASERKVQRLERESKSKASRERVEAVESELSRARIRLKSCVRRAREDKASWSEALDVLKTENRRLVIELDKAIQSPWTTVETPNSTAPLSPLHTRNPEGVHSFLAASASRRVSTVEGSRAVAVFPAPFASSSIPSSSPPPPRMPRRPRRSMADAKMIVERYRRSPFKRRERDMGKGYDENDFGTVAPPKRRSPREAASSSLSSFGTLLETLRDRDELGDGTVLKDDFVCVLRSRSRKGSRLSLSDEDVRQCVLLFETTDDPDRIDYVAFVEFLKGKAS